MGVGETIAAMTFMICLTIVICVKMVISLNDKEN